ncbi:MAG: hypothetical protein K6G15_03815 [Desulfovibrio sp.]|nr:hypothetical protein [Desulfovibrio sp.]
MSLLGRVYDKSEFIWLMDLLGIIYVPHIEFATFINESNLTKYEEIPYDEIDNEKYIYLVKRDGILEIEVERVKDKVWVMGFKIGERTLVGYSGGSITPGGPILDPFAHLWFNRAEVDEFIAKHPYYASLDAVSTKKSSNDQWKKLYQHLASIIDSAQNGTITKDQKVKLSELERIAGQSSEERTQAATQVRLANINKKWKESVPDMLKVLAHFCTTDASSKKNGQTAWSYNDVKKYSEEMGYNFTSGMYDAILEAMPEKLKCVKSKAY